MMRPRNIIILVMVGFFLAWVIAPLLQTPEDQATRQHLKLLQAVQQGDVPAVRSMLAEDYKDEWFSSLNDALDTLSEVSRFIRAYEIHTNEEPIASLISRDRDSEPVVVIEHPISLFPRQNTPLPPPQLPNTKWIFRWKQDRSFPPRWKLFNAENQDFDPKNY